MKKLLVLSHYKCYDNGEGDVLCEMLGIEDTRDSIKTAVESLDIDLDLSSVFGYEDFLNGKTKSFDYDLDNYDDWDEPSGGFVVIRDKDEIIKEITDTYNSEIEKIEKLF